jgi:1-acyl-sn-glycerol-3-phosphate acyltransferase
VIILCAAFFAADEQMMRRLSMSGLASRVSRCWRILGTGISFATFMTGGLFMTLTVFPVVRTWPGPKEVKGRRIRRLVQLSFVAFVRWMTFLGVMHKPKIEGLENVARTGPCLIIANHPTLIDVVLLVSLIRDCNCVVKRALWEHFFLGGVVRAAEYIPNDDGPQLIESCRRGFKQGRPLIIFPEGTRSPEIGTHPFSRGAAQFALRAEARVVPVVIVSSPPTLMKHQRWHEVPDRVFQLTLRFHPAAVVPAEILGKEELPKRVRALTRHFEGFFRQELVAAQGPTCNDK